MSPLPPISTCPRQRSRRCAWRWARAISVSDFLRVTAHYPFALVGSHDDEEFSPKFGFTLRFGFGLPESMQLAGYGERDWTRGEIAIHTAAGPLREQIWGLGLGSTVSLA